MAPLSKETAAHRPGIRMKCHPTYMPSCNFGETLTTMILEGCFRACLYVPRGEAACEDKVHYQGELPRDLEQSQVGARVSCIAQLQLPWAAPAPPAGAHDDSLVARGKIVQHKLCQVVEVGCAESQVKQLHPFAP